ncbi:MAG: adenine-specific methyltransferase EcoRI family protein [Patescibacteria group bacterium]
MANSNLTNAKKAKNDEFYTQYNDIQKEIEAYLEYNPDAFRGKIILLPCDDPEWSNFTKFLAQNFQKLGLKKLISTSYASDSKSYKSDYQPTLFEANDSQYNKNKTSKNGKIFTLTHDKTGDGKTDVEDLEWRYLKGDGDFKSDEIKKLRDEADIIITNPPFSLFREFLAWIVEANKQFVIIGNMNAITYKEVFPLIKENKAWLGATGNGSDMVFAVPKGTEVDEKDKQKAARLGYVGDYTRLGNSCWFTNLDHGRRHKPLPLMTMEDNLKYSKHKEVKGKESYNRYDNYDAIEVPFTDAIPSDYKGVIGVPISFLDKYSPEQFSILGTSDNGIVDDKFKKTPGLTKEFVADYYKAGGTGAYKEGNPTAGYYENNVAKMAYKRIFIRHNKK